MRATDLARRMVSEYGMSKELGPVRLASDPQTLYLGGQAGIDTRLSPETAAAIDRETRRLVQEAAERAYELLSEKRKQLTELSERLFEAETVTGEELAGLLDGGPPSAAQQPRRTAAKVEA